MERGTTDRGALRAADQVLEAGEPLSIFPEGTRQHGPTLGDLYDGVAYLALRRRVPIVPVGIGGSEQILPKGRVLPRPRRVVVVVGEPIVADAETTARRRADVTALSGRLRAALQAAFDDAARQAGAGGLAAQVGEGA